MSLLGVAVASLRERGTPFALVGAGALAVHGVVRGTRDLDLLVADAACLDAGYWDAARRQGVEVEIHCGDADDPLAGAVRLRRGHEPPVDVLVGRHAWQRDLLGRARPVLVEGVEVPVVERADLILLKLYAGGPGDLWDVAALLAGPERERVAAVVEARLEALPAGCRALWARVARAAAEPGEPA